MVACRSWTLTRSTDGLVADLVGLAVVDAALDAAAGQPGGEGVRVVVAAGCRPSATIGSRPNSPPQITSVESSRPRCFRSVSRPAIGHGRSRRRTGGGCRRCRCGRPSSARSPCRRSRSARSARRAPPAAGPSGTAGRSGRTSDCRGRRACWIVLRLPVDVERLGGGHLHAVGQLEALDAGGQLRPRPRAPAGGGG